MTTLTIHLRAETATKLRELAERSGQTIEAFLEQLAEQTVIQAKVDAWLAWVNSHQPLGHPIDDSRDSIYEGRGE